MAKYDSAAVGQQNGTINKKTKERLLSSKGINIGRARPAHCNCESHQRRYHDLLNSILQTSPLFYNKSIANIQRGYWNEYLNSKILMIQIKDSDSSLSFTRKAPKTELIFSRVLNNRMETRR